VQRDPVYTERGIGEAPGTVGTTGGQPHRHPIVIVIVIVVVIVIVALSLLLAALLLAATATAGVMWGRSGWIAAAVLWACVPLAHVVKHVLGLPDTLHPNTSTSIVYLAAFTLVVATVGAGCGVLVRRLATGPVRPDEGPA
jgi:hypothetical protein